VPDRDRTPGDRLRDRIDPDHATPLLIAGLGLATMAVVLEAALPPVGQYALLAVGAAVAVVGAVVMEDGADDGAGDPEGTGEDADDPSDER
jgi:hypothetical protein